jgi:hypothetical protein
LPGQTDFRQDQMPRVTADFFVVKVHKIYTGRIEWDSSVSA